MESFASSSLALVTTRRMAAIITFDGRAGDRDEQLLHRLRRVLLHLRRAAERVEDDLVGRELEGARDQAVGELVERDAHEQEQHEQHAEQRTAEAVHLSPLEGAEHQHQRERDVELHVDAGDADQAKRPRGGAHATPRLGATRAIVKGRVSFPPEVRVRLRARVLIVATLTAACDRRSAHVEPPVHAGAEDVGAVVSATAAAAPALAPVIVGDVREAARQLFGVPPRPGRLIGTVDAATNGDPQANEAGVLVTSGARGKVFTVYAAGNELRIGGPIDLGSVRSLAVDGPHVCASDRRTLRCANVDGSGVVQRSTGATETTGLWGGPGILLRATASGLDDRLRGERRRVPHRARDRHAEAPRHRRSGRRDRPPGGPR